jgi:hypothetical protein
MLNERLIHGMAPKRNFDSSYAALGFECFVTPASPRVFQQPASRARLSRGPGHAGPRGFSASLIH